MLEILTPVEGLDSEGIIEENEGRRRQPEHMTGGLGGVTSPSVLSVTRPTMMLPPMVICGEKPAC